MKSFRRFFLLIVCITLITCFANAAEKGTLRVKVVDVEQGTVLQGVPVTISSPIMMGTRTTISNMDGEALFINLTPGAYEVKAELEGFKTVVSRDVKVSLDVETVVHVRMETAQIQETVTVTADIPAVNTTKSAIAEHVS
ncbi:MAG: carboxypeptidase regulatory-like domain-containing protein, partial [Candidatus Aminicenantes bacterium]